MLTNIEIQFFETATKFFKSFHKKEGIDWEERKWELVKEMTAAREGASYGKGVSESAERIISDAESLITEYRKRM